jgi:hypothetical protein
MPIPGSSNHRGRTKAWLADIWPFLQQYMQDCQTGMSCSCTNRLPHHFLLFPKVQQ